MSYFIFEHKKVYYEELGEGKPLLFLHGNTASSKMFSEITQKYRGDFRVLLIDFLGHGKSDRLQKFPADLWFWEGQQALAFLHQKNLTNVSIIGCSGGALAAINAALEAPDLIDRVIADSFEGERPLAAFTEHLSQDRALSKKEGGKLFYQSMHGSDWEQIVDHDTDAILRHSKEIGVFFHKPLQAIKADLLLTGSKDDEFMCSATSDYFEKIYGELLKKIGHGKMYLFEKGGHPAMLTNPAEFYEISRKFLI